MIFFFIDDDTDDQEIFSMAMSEVDPSVTCKFANDGIEALAELNDETFIPGCIFIDLNMPRMNGNECLIEIRKIDRLAKVPVFIYSTSANPQRIEENKQLGATDFIVKPYGLGALTEILTRILQNNKPYGGS